MEWVRVDEMLPDEDELVWILVENGDMGACFWSNENGWEKVDDSDCCGDVTHWMRISPPNYPIPEEPEEISVPVDLLKRVVKELDSYSGGLASGDWGFGFEDICDNIDEIVSLLNARINQNKR